MARLARSFKHAAGARLLLCNCWAASVGTLSVLLPLAVPELLLLAMPGLLMLAVSGLLLQCSSLSLLCLSTKAVNWTMPHHTLIEIALPYYRSKHALLSKPLLVLVTTILHLSDCTTDGAVNKSSTASLTHNTLRQMIADNIAHTQTGQFTRVHFKGERAKNAFNYMHSCTQVFTSALCIPICRHPIMHM